MRARARVCICVCNSDEINAKCSADEIDVSIRRLIKSFKFAAYAACFPCSACSSRARLSTYSKPHRSSSVCTHFIHSLLHWEHVFAWPRISLRAKPRYNTSPINELLAMLPETHSCSNPKRAQRSIAKNSHCARKKRISSRMVRKRRLQSISSHCSAGSLKSLSSEQIN